MQDENRMKKFYRICVKEKKNKTNLSNISQSGEKIKPGSQLAYSLAQLDNAS